MADYTKYLREYMCEYNTGNTWASVRVYNTYDAQEYFSPLPTSEELDTMFGGSGLKPGLGSCFEDCTNMKAAPRLPDDVYDASFQGLTETFQNCSSLVIPPKVPAKARLDYTFKGCTSLVQAPVIPINPANTGIYYMFQGCTSLVAPCSIPPGIRYIQYMFDGCTNLTGEMVVRPTPTNYNYALRNTVKPITLYGDKTLCEAIAATANNGNAAWSAWYDPTPAVTNRGPGSYTTAADITRMVRNGALAVNTYAPGRMVYQQGDIVREDEWNALVEAAKTIDQTVTYSTIYSNLNKIEAAFDSAL